MNIALVYIEVPETHTVVLLKDVTPDLAAELRSVAGTFMNGAEMTKEQQEIHIRISEHLSPLPKYGYGLWRQYVVTDATDLPPDTLLVICGFLL